MKSNSKTYEATELEQMVSNWHVEQTEANAIEIGYALNECDPSDEAQITLAFAQNIIR